jgi:hypothetical protein|tara:strand:- start:1188 stop:1532 length:345 start_codon:yes stop_codon:yes gene_type:complete
MTSFTVTLPCKTCDATGWEDLVSHGTNAGGQWADIHERECLECDGIGTYDKVVSNFTSIWDVADEYLDCTQIVSNENVSLKTEQKKKAINHLKHSPWRFVEYGIAKREEIEEKE